MGVRERTDVDKPRPAFNVHPCHLKLHVDGDGCVHVAIEKSKAAGNAISGSNVDAAAQLPLNSDINDDHVTSGDRVPSQDNPILLLPGVMASQNMWTSAETFDIPTILQYSAEQDTMLAWRRRMAPLR